MVTTQAGSSASPQGRATSPPAPPDGTGTSPVAPQDRAVSPPGMVGIISATIPTKSDIFVHVLTNVLKQPSDGPLAQALNEAGIKCFQQFTHS